MTSGGTGGGRGSDPRLAGPRRPGVRIRLTALVAGLGLALLARARAAAPPTSFAAGTMISTPSGMRPIERIQIGDRVHGYHFASGAIRVQRVDAIRHRFRSDLVVVDLGGWSLKVTPDHRIWSATGFRYKRAAVLSPGEVLGIASWYWHRREPAGLSRVVAVRPTSPEPVFDLEIHNGDNYLLGPDRVIVRAGRAGSPQSPFPPLEGDDRRDRRDQRVAPR